MSSYSPTDLEHGAGGGDPDYFDHAPEAPLVVCPQCELQVYANELNDHPDHATACEHCE
jgi:hypothetical protein